MWLKRGLKKHPIKKDMQQEEAKMKWTRKNNEIFKDKSRQRGGAEEAPTDWD